MLDLEHPKAIHVPLRVDECGAVRVGDTRVSLLSVLTSFQRGDTAEQIVHSYPSLELSDVYAVVSYYLLNRVDVDAWLASERDEGERIEKKARARYDQSGIRERLVQRMSQR